MAELPSTAVTTKQVTTKTETETKLKPVETTPNVSLPTDYEA